MKLASMSPIYGVLSWFLVASSSVLSGSNALSPAVSLAGGCRMLSSTAATAAATGGTRRSTALRMHNKKRSSKTTAAKTKGPSSSGAATAHPSKGFAGGGTTALQSSVPTMTDSFPYAGGIRPGRQSPQRVVAASGGILLPDYAIDGRPKRGSGSPLLPWVIDVKAPEEIEKMRASGRLARRVLDMAGRAAKVGVTTDEIDALVHEMIVDAGAYPSPLNYHGAYRWVSPRMVDLMAWSS
jgi:hypothetical protein